MLVDAETGQPTWWPTLFTTTQLRNTGKSVATMEVALRAIQLLLSHVEDAGIDLEDRFRARRLLKPNEIQALCDAARSATRGNTPVSAAHYFNRLSYIATYLGWVATEIIGQHGTREDAKAIEQMVRQVQSRRPPVAPRNLHRDRGIQDTAHARLFAIIEPTHPDNPFTNPRAAVRNRLAILLLAHTGIRKGELLGIQVPDIDWSAGTLTINRRPDDDHDPRKDQPRVKTLARTLTLSRELVEDLDQYIRHERRQTRGANTHRYPFVVHQRGKAEGKPLDISGFNSVFKTLKQADPELAGLRPHAFRHLWNYRYSVAMDSKPRGQQVSPEEQEKIRCHQMGWVEGSTMAKHYNQRFIEKQAQRAALELSAKLASPAKV